MKTLIIGGSGFVGSHLTPFLAEKGFDSTVMARRPERGPWQGDWKSAGKTIVHACAILHD